MGEPFVNRNWEGKQTVTGEPPASAATAGDELWDKTYIRLGQMIQRGTAEQAISAIQMLINITYLQKDIKGI